MRIRILYDSEYGNTEGLARAMADALRPAHSVALVTLRAESASPGIGEAELTIVGGPTQGRGVSRAMRTFLAAVPELHGAAVAAFDTRLDAPRIFTGAASGTIARRIRGCGGRVVVEPESFLVGGREGPLIAGERERAVAWAQRAVAHVGRPDGP